MLGGGKHCRIWLGRAGGGGGAGEAGGGGRGEEVNWMRVLTTRLTLCSLGGRDSSSIVDLGDVLSLLKRKAKKMVGSFSPCNSS